MNKLLNDIKKIKKGYFTLNDIKKISNFNDATLRVSISRLLKSGDITKIKNGFYTLDMSRIDMLNFAVSNYSPSYISFEYALARYDILSQKPYHITCATTKISKRIELKNSTIFYKKIKKDIFWGYFKEGNYLIAEKEKAFLDQAYLSLNGYANFDMEEMNLKLLNKKKLKEYLKRFNNKRLTNLINRVII